MARSKFHCIPVTVPESRDRTRASPLTQFAVGGENKWKYKSFVNWKFFPSEDLPILVYFKETQTPSVHELDDARIVLGVLTCIPVHCVRISGMSALESGRTQRKPLRMEPSQAKCTSSRAFPLQSF